MSEGGNQSGRDDFKFFFGGRSPNKRNQRLHSFLVLREFTRKRKTKAPPETIAVSELFILSEYILDCKRYHGELTDITWRDCDLRKWLNNEFYNAAFSATEKKLRSANYFSYLRIPKGQEALCRGELYDQKGRQALVYCNDLQYKVRIQVPIYR